MRLCSGQVAERAGVNLQTLRYYERRGLIAEPARSPGGHRTYPPETVTLLTVIKAAQRLGFTLEEVAEFLDTGRRGHPTPDLRERAQEKIAEVDARIADLTTIRRAQRGGQRRLRQPDPLHLPRLSSAVCRPGHEPYP
ncbi:MerR family transcriptional regulator [Streptosporangium lutulentum]|uniref:DNA-binding transcriptional MerR regulator n=1 Tax=Streptosporangium lutulentum TaxID=1461250 RepID=A0ABT9QA33_9ACTN|nr:MerR family transcriptional regulator [Streptosporangium lutulentum]MDP9843612.1 DNA-binding transcriptional MerR regulator [Streptosporangium lutulentum]